MSSMSEDALFKAILKNKPASTQTTQKVPERKEVPKPTAASSEDAMYKVLLKNRPQQQNKPVIAAPQVETYESPVIETKITQEVNPVQTPVQTDIAVESIKNLTASVNMVYGLMKSVIVPVLVLILIVGIAVLIKLR